MKARVLVRETDAKVVSLYERSVQSGEYGGYWQTTEPTLDGKTIMGDGSDMHAAPLASLFMFLTAGSFANRLEALF